MFTYDVAGLNNVKKIENDDFAPEVTQVLVDNFNLRLISGDAQADLKEMLK